MFAGVGGAGDLRSDEDQTQVSLTPAQDKKARRGFRGYPVATIAFYGPDDTRATKVAVGIVPQEDAEPEVLERWGSETVTAGVLE